MENKNILISGASIAGPAVAYWLNKYGLKVTVIERAATLREGGYKIDIRGAAIKVVERMELLKQIKTMHTDMLGASFINSNGKTLATLDPEVFGFRAKDDVEIMRGDLSKIIYEATKNEVEYIFNDSITSLEEQRENVKVTFQKGETRTFDLVIGADGMNSNVRNLSFGKDPGYITHLGFNACIFTVPDFLKLDRWEMIYPLPGKAINIYNTPQSKNAKALFLFHSKNLDQPAKNQKEQKKLMRDTFFNTGWESEKLLDMMERAEDFYFDSVSQVNIKRLYKGRIVLLGDAGYCPSLASGQGTSLALVGAYVLAGELKSNNCDYKKAFESYQNEIAFYKEKNLQLGRDNVKQMVPDKAWKLRLQMIMLSTIKYFPWKSVIIKKITESVNDAANAITLKNYS